MSTHLLINRIFNIEAGLFASAENRSFGLLDVRRHCAIKAKEWEINVPTKTVLLKK